ncbi:MAG: endo alpha-1,4 polygalactosaminidase [Anaerolineales bacterium]|nr:endo alpha-1,4 polygalactosaminidase [Anaerolineales bacterium]
MSAGTPKVRHANGTHAKARKASEAIDAKAILRLGVFTTLFLLAACSFAPSFGDIPVQPTETFSTIPAQEVSQDSNWWQPAPGTSWQWQLSGEIDTTLDVQVYDIDLFEAPQNVIDELHADGRVVICYFSAGSWEDWREDADDFPTELLGKELEGWPDEKWLDIRQIELLAPIMEARLDLAVDKGCDGVEPDNMDGYANQSGFSLTYQDQLEYNLWLAEVAHARGLSIGLKNDLDQIQDLVLYFDWALNEECFYYDECDLLLPFVHSGKSVFGVEYELDSDEFCPQVNAMNFDFLKKNWELDAWREPCR